MRRRTVLSLFAMVIAGTLVGCGGHPNGEDTDGQYIDDESRSDAGSRLVSVEVDLSGEGTQALGDWKDENGIRMVQEFSRELFLRSMDQQNPVLSPVSAYLAMAMAGSGAAGETLTEFHEVMGAEFEAASEAMMHTLPQDGERLRVSIANSAWVDDQLSPVKMWSERVSTRYLAQVFYADLATEQTMADINDWVRDKTQGLIPGFLSQPLEEDDRLALFNSIYFKGDWSRKFLARDTQEREFIREDGHAVLTEFMAEYMEMRSYVQNSLGDGIILPYQDGNLAFVAIRPREGLTVRQMYEQLSVEALETLLSSGEERLVNLRLPKFEVTFDRVLNEDLEDMGLRRAFDGEQVDLSGLGTTETGYPLYISLVHQKAVIRVDEEGTEAAAVTEVIVTEETAMLMPEDPIEVYFDRPFLYMILEMDTYVPLFLGIYENPPGALACD